MFRYLTTCLMLFSSESVLAALPVQDFLKDPEFGSISLSPTGEYVAVTVPIESRNVLAVIRLSDMKTTGMFKPENDAYIDDVMWVSDRRVIFNTAKKLGRLESPVALYGLWAMNSDGSVKKRFSDSRWVLSGLPDSEIMVLVEYWDPLYHDTYGMQDTRTGKLLPSREFSPAKKTGFDGIGYYSDWAGNVLVFVARRKGTEEEVYFMRGAPADSWRMVYDEGESRRDIDFMGFSAGSRSVYFRSENSEDGPDSVISIDLKSGERTVVAADDNVSPFGVLRSPRDASVHAIRFLDGTPRYHYLDPEGEDARDHIKLRSSFPGEDVLPLDYTKDGNVGLYYVRSDRNPGDYYLYDRRTGKANYFLSDKRWIDPDTMSRSGPERIKTRDGLEVEAFLTLPAGKNGASPLVVYPHGGPFGVFDTWGFDPEVQLLANRGYAVLQVNFRGSGNYGRRFEKAGYRQWGRAMQDDLTDATHWAIRQGHADPGRICIYGASYGAYAALMGAVREPGLYACAIGNVGVYDLPKMLKDDSKHSETQYSRGWWAKKFFVETLGTEGLDAISPVNLAASVKVPVLLAAGELDYTAPASHSKAMHRALLDAGGDSNLKVYANEGHGNFLQENRIDWANRVLEFLDRHIGKSSAGGKR